MESKYIIDGVSADPERHEEVDKTLPLLTSTRPTGEMLAQTYGRGEYIVYRPDGQAIRSYTVRLNRKGSLSVETLKATGLEALSSLNLERLLKRFDGITKIWPAGVASQVRKVQQEISTRKILIDMSTARELANA